MIDSKNITLGSHKGSEQDYIDKVDLAIRVLLNMCRQMKQRVTVRNRVLRNLGTREKARVSLVLEKLVLPPELLEQQEEDVLEAESIKEVSCLELVPVEPEKIQKQRSSLAMDQPSRPRNRLKVLASLNFLLSSKGCPMRLEELRRLLPCLFHKSQKLGVSRPLWTKLWPMFLLK